MCSHHLERSRRVKQSHFLHPHRCQLPLTSSPELTWGFSKAKLQVEGVNDSLNAALSSESGLN